MNAAEVQIVSKGKKHPCIKEAVLGADLENGQRDKYIILLIIFLLISANSMRPAASVNALSDRIVNFDVNYIFF